MRWSLSESPGQGKECSQVDGVSDLAPPSGSVALWEEVSEKGQWPLLTSLSGRKLSTCLDARHFSSSLCDSGIFQAATPVLDLTGSEFE